MMFKGPLHVIFLRLGGLRPPHMQMRQSFSLVMCPPLLIDDHVFLISYIFLPFVEWLSRRWEDIIQKFCPMKKLRRSPK